MRSLLKLRLCTSTGPFTHSTLIRWPVPCDLFTARLWFRLDRLAARPDAHAQLLAHQGELRLASRQLTGQADDQPGHAGADGAHIAELRQEGRDGPVALSVYTQPDVFQRD